MKFKKMICAICLGAMALFFTPVTAMADTIIFSNEQLTVSEISPRTQYIRDILTVLSISGTTATVDVAVEGYANQATKAKVIAELQVKSGTDNWIPVKIWTVEEDNYRAEVYETYTVTSGNTYRVKVTAYVWQGDAYESQIVYSPEKTA